MSNTIVFAGDSVTQGAWTVDSGGAQLTGLTTDQKFSTLIGNARGFSTVVNAGKSGDTAAGLASRLSADVLSHSPDAVAIMIGVNDVDTGTPTPVVEFKLSLYGIIETLQAASVRPTLLMPNLVRSSPVGIAFPAYLNAMNEVAVENSVPIVPIYDLFCRQWLAVANQSTFDALFHDYKHMTAAGHRFIADCVLAHNAAACA
jgi:lysophospholipase L1-like esterase